MGLEAHEFGEDFFHDVGGAAADGEEACVAPGAGYRAFFHVADAAVELEAAVDDAHGGVADHEFCHGDFALAGYAAVEEVGCMVGETTTGFELGFHVDEFVARDLETGDGAAEGVAFAAVFDRVVEYDLGGGDSGESSDKTFALEVLHDVVKAVAFFAEHVTCRDAAVVEEEFGGVGGVISDFFELLSDRESGGIGWKQKQADAAVVVFWVGAHGQRQEISACAVGDVGFLAVDDEIVAVGYGGRDNRGDITTSIRFGHCQCRDFLASNSRH